MYPLFNAAAADFFSYAWKAPSGWLHGRHAMQPAPKTRHSSDCGLSLPWGKSKAKKLMRIANNRHSRELLLRPRNSDVASRARVREKKAAAFPEFFQFSSQQG